MTVVVCSCDTGVALRNVCSVVAVMSTVLNLSGVSLGPYTTVVGAC